MLGIVFVRERKRKGKKKEEARDIHNEGWMMDGEERRLEAIRRVLG